MTDGQNEQFSRRTPIAQPPKRLRRMRFYMATVAVDCAIISGNFLIANVVRFGFATAAPGSLFAAFFVPLYLLMALQQSCYSSDLLFSWRRSAFRSVSALAAAMTVIILAAFYLQISMFMSRAVFSIGCALSAAALILSRRVLYHVAARAFDGAPLNELLICDGLDTPEGESMTVVHATVLGLRPDLGDPQMLDRLGQLFKDVDRVVVACPPERRAEWAKILRGASVRGEFLTPEIDATAPLGSAHYAGAATLIVSWGPLNTVDRALKRALDLTLGIAAIIVLAPILLPIAIAIRLDSKGPIFFVQSRLGQGNRLFRMYKFRSMHTDMCDGEGKQSTIRGDKRITRVGSFIRATSIDELPQIINVLKGDMSFVGPRPHALGSRAGDKLFWEVDSRYWSRHAAKPGITGLAQVRGFRGATHLQSDLSDRLKADLEYLKDWSIWRDLAILAATFKVVFHKNAY